MLEFSRAWGGSSEVYKSSYKDKAVAIKEFNKSNKDEEFNRAQKTLFENEIAILKTAAHPRIIILYDSSFEKGVCKLILELGERDLRYRFFGYKPLGGSPQLRMRYAMESAEALTYLHGIDVIHLDVNLANILLVENGEHVKLTDFGRSVKLKPGQAVYEPGIIFGTPAYEPPEALQHKSYSRKSDVYSFGIVLGALRFNQEPHRDEPLVISEDCQGEARAFILSFWSKEPSKRPEIKVATDQSQMKKFFAIK